MLINTNSDAIFNILQMLHTFKCQKWKISYFQAEIIGNLLQNLFKEEVSKGRRRRKVERKSRQTENFANFFSFIFELKIKSLNYWKMSGLPLLTSEPAYQSLQKYFDENAEKINIQQLFKSDPKRFEKFR